jgi:uncharacterized membrane protein YcaP (DUF421 family)
VSITLGAVLSRCITGGYPFFPTLSAAMFLAVFHRFCAWLCYKSEWVRKLIEGESVILYENGNKILRHLKKFSLTDQDIVKALHEESIDDISKVKSMWLEPDGKISVVKKDN